MPTFILSFMLCNFVGWVVWAYLSYYFALFAVGRSPWSQWGLASFPGSPRARTKNRKERGELGRIYHVRNVIGKENLITHGRTNELTHASWLLIQLRKLMANRTGLGSTTLHYLAVRETMVSVHRPVHSKMTLTYLLTWQTDRFPPRWMAFKALISAKTVVS